MRSVNAKVAGIMLLCYTQSVFIAWSSFVIIPVILLSDFIVLSGKQLNLKTSKFSYLYPYFCWIGICIHALTTNNWAGFPFCVLFAVPGFFMPLHEGIHSNLSRVTFLTNLAFSLGGIPFANLHVKHHESSNTGDIPYKDESLAIYTLRYLGYLFYTALTTRKSNTPGNFLIRLCVSMFCFAILSLVYDQVMVVLLFIGLQFLHVSGAYITHYGLKSSNKSWDSRSGLTSTLLFLGGNNHSMHHKRPAAQSVTLASKSSVAGHGHDLGVTYLQASILAIIPDLFFWYMNKRFKALQIEN